MIATALHAGLALGLVACGGGGKSSANGQSPVVATNPPAGSGTGSGTGTNSPIVLPIEVLSDGGELVKQVVLTIPQDKKADVGAIWFVCHRCGFFSAPEFEKTTRAPVAVKASVRLLGDAAKAGADALPWVDISDENVVAGKLKINASARVQGGISHGGLYTIGVALVLDQAMRDRLVGGDNTFEFRFNGTEGESNGFRVLKVQALDRAGQALSTNKESWVDPLVEKNADLGALNAQDVANGKVLWLQTHIRKNAIVDRTINASCGSCHARGGRDLEYFNYSDNAIKLRAKFHGLSDAQASAIVAYVRSTDLDTPVPYVASAAPWNPPYQPTPGMDQRPVEEWAAGGGLEAVADDTLKPIALDGSGTDDGALPYAEKMFQAVFKVGSQRATQGDFNTAMGPDKTLNFRELTLPAQFADWNAWLPDVAPQDIWPEVFDPGRLSSASIGKCNATGLEFDFLCTYATAKAALDVNFEKAKASSLGWYSLPEADIRTLRNQLYTTGLTATQFIGAGRNAHYGRAQDGADTLRALANAATMNNYPVEYYSRASFVERATESLYRWNAVQQWDLMQSYKLEDANAAFRGYIDPATDQRVGAERRGWPTHTRSTFYLAHHMIYQQYNGRTQDDTSDSDVMPDGRPRANVLAWERDNYVGAFYRSNAWYLQALVVSAGTRETSIGTVPIDWDYTVTHARSLGDFARSKPDFPTTVYKNASIEAGDAAAVRDISLAHYISSVAVRIKRIQADNTTLVQDGYPRRTLTLEDHVAGFLMDTKIPTTVDRYRSPFRGLDALSPGLYKKMLTGYIQGFNQLLASTGRSDWRTCAPDAAIADRTCLRETLQPMLVDDSGSDYVDGTKMSSDMILRYTLLGADQEEIDPAVVGKLRAWTEQLWPGQP